MHRGSDLEALAAVGQMTATVVHEIRNPLAGISGALQIIAERLPSSGSDAAVFLQIQERLGDVNRLVDDLLYFARLGEPDAVAISLSGCAKDALEIAARLARQDVAVDFDFAAGAAAHDVSVVGDRAMLAELLGRLFANAAAAAAIDHPDASGQRVAVRVVVAGAMAEVEVPGGPESNVGDEGGLVPFAHVGGRNVGLALAIVRRIAELHRGDAVLRPTGDKRANVVVTLPIARD